jgi:hypothetical protein
VKFRGRPVLGAVSGLLFGLFVAVDLQQFGVRPLDSVSLFVLPAIGLVLGLLLAWWAPFARKPKPTPGPPPITKKAPEAEPDAEVTLTSEPPASP